MSTSQYGRHRWWKKCVYDILLFYVTWTWHIMVGAVVLGSWYSALAAEEKKLRQIRSLRSWSRRKMCRLFYTIFADDSPTEPRTTEPRKTEPRKTQPRMDWTSNGLNPDWTEPRMGLNPEKTEPRMGLNPDWTQPRMGLNPEWDWTPNGLNPDWTEPRLGLNPDWTQPWLGLNPDWTELRMGLNPDWDSTSNYYQPRIWCPMVFIKRMDF